MGNEEDDGNGAASSCCSCPCSWDETHAAAEYWEAAVGAVVVAGGTGGPTPQVYADESLPLPPLGPLPPSSSTPISEGAGGGGGSGDGHKGEGEGQGQEKRLHVMSAPVLDDGASLLDHPDLVWAEDTWDEAREEEARETVDCQGAALPAHRVKWYERTAGRHWDLFYKRNENRFFKDRHYLLRDFPDLVPPPSSSSDGAGAMATMAAAVASGGGGGIMRADDARPAPHHTVLVEAGCGVGNAVFPLLESHPGMFVYALDFSVRAVDLVKSHPLYAASRRCRAFVCDLVNDPVPPAVVKEGGGADFVLCMYSLSAMAPEAMPAVARKLHAALKPGGRLLLRDYGRWDEAQLRFKRGHKLADHFYLRSDGTRAYYFSLEDLRRIFVEEAGFREVEAGFIRRVYANRGQGATRRRTWVHARFEKLAVVASAVVDG